MKNSFLWHDANIDKPTDEDVRLVLTEDGYVLIAQYDGEWFCLDRDMALNNVVWWTDFKLPHGWNISDDYYEE